MTDQPTSAPPSSQQILFPAFIYGEKTPCRRKMNTEAQKWGKAYLAEREFPEPKLVPIAPGSVVFTDESRADLVRFGYHFIPNTNMVLVDGDAAKEDAHHIQWRVYLIDDLRNKALSVAQQLIGKQLSRDESWAFDRAVNAFLCKYPWGALSAACSISFLSDIAATVARMNGVLRYWEGLDTLKYLGPYNNAIYLSEYMASWFQGEIAMWVDRPTGNIRTDLHTAMDHMGHASPDEIYTRLLRRLQELVNSERALKQRDWLRFPGIIERGVEAERRWGEQYYDNLTSGQDRKLGGFLISLERQYGPGGDLTLP